MDVFLQRGYRPMLIGRDEPPFDDEDYLFELKLDGIRCLAYVDGADLSLVSRRGLELSPRLPELHGIGERVSGPCILDGELVVLDGGLPDFEKAKERVLSTDALKAGRLAKAAPATFVVFDLLYQEGTELIRRPLYERRRLLEKAVDEGGRLALTRIVEGRGIALFEAAKEQQLEGVIAKRKNSLYFPGKRTADWAKCKNLLDDDFVICGYIRNEDGSISLVLGQYDLGRRMLYCGHVVLGKAEADFAAVLKLKKTGVSPFAEPVPAGNADASWVEPELVCRCTFLARTKDGLMRHPVYKELRIDKVPDDTAMDRASVPGRH